MSQHNEDRDKVINALGGAKGLIDSGLPAVIFLVVFNISGELRNAIWGALALSLALAIYRLADRKSVV